MTDSMHPPRLDPRQAADAAQLLAGQAPLSIFGRLMAETRGHGGERVLCWQAQPQWRRDDAGTPHCWLHLRVQVSLPLVCQRCLGPFDVGIAVDRDFRFVASEAEAEAQDDEAEEDLLVWSRDFDLGALIEDEVLMAMPLVPRHEDCPVAVKLSAVDADFDATGEKPNPFAALAELKAKPGR